jgi:hypothetical protein
VNRAYPALKAAAADLLKHFGASYTGTPAGHIATDIAGAASVAGSTLLRAAVPDLEQYPVGQFILADVHEGYDQFFRFMAATGAGLDVEPYEGWNDSVPANHKPLLEVAEMVGKLQTPLAQIELQHRIPRKFQGYAAALAAMQLVAAGDRLGILEQRIGKALAIYYVIAGSKTVPPPREGDW